MIRTLGIHIRRRGPAVLGLDTRLRDCADPRGSKRFLFLQYETALGTAVNATPVFEALRRDLPDAHLAVACSGITHEVLRASPYIDELYVTPHPLRNYSRAMLYFMRKIYPRRRAYDCVVIDSGNRRSRVSSLAIFSGISCRIGISHRRDLLHHSIEYDPALSVLENNLRTLSLVGISTRRVEPSIFYTDHDREHISNLFLSKGIDQSGPLIAIQAQTSGGQPNRWFDERFVEVADTLHYEMGAEIIFVGADSERLAIENMRVGMKSRSYSAAGSTNIAQLAALLAGCDLLVTLDTGTMHVGRAVGLPMVIIAPAWQPEHEWLPIGSEGCLILRHSEIGCADCRLFSCKTRECMSRTTVGDVVRAARTQLARYPARKESRVARISKSLLDAGEWPLKC